MGVAVTTLTSVRGAPTPARSGAGGDRRSGGRRGFRVVARGQGGPDGPELRELGTAALISGRVETAGVEWTTGGRTGGTGQIPLQDDARATSGRVRLGHGGAKRDGVRVPGRRQQRLGRSRLHDPA